jgi:hypothetical protein
VNTIELFLKEVCFPGNLGVGRRGFLHMQKSEAQTYTTTLLNQARMRVGKRAEEALSTRVRAGNFKSGAVY